MLLVAAAQEELGPYSGEVVGVGPVVAAAAMAALLGRHRPDAVVMVGTGAAYMGGPALGTACVARRVGQQDGAALMGQGYVPRPPAPIPSDPRLLARIDLPQVDVLTTGSVTTDPVLAARLADGWQVEHLEAFGVARACFDQGVPFVAVLGIANQAGADAHAQWLSWRTPARESARAGLISLLGPPGGAPPSSD